MRKSIPKKLREQVKNKFAGHCAYCGQKPDRLQIDHLVPVSLAHQVYSHGLADVNALDNLMPACFSCNNYKLNRTLEQFRQDLAEQVWRARRYSLNFRLAERFGLLQVTDRPIEFYFERKPADD